MVFGIIDIEQLITDSKGQISGALVDAGKETEYKGIYEIADVSEKTITLTLTTTRKVHSQVINRKIIIKLPTIINICITLYKSNNLMKKVMTITLKERIRNQTIKTDLKMEQYTQKMKEFTSLESKDEKLERSVKIQYFFVIALYLIAILVIICTLLYFSIPFTSYSGTKRLSIATNPQGRFLLFAMALCFSPFGIAILYGIMIRFKTYKVLTQRYIEKFGSKPKIKSFDYVFSPY